MNYISRQESTSFVPSTNVLSNKEMSLSTEWTKEQNEAYEKALASLESELDLTNDEELEKILWQIPGNKTLAELKEHHQRLIDDVANIISEKVPLPSYTDDKKMMMKMKMKKKELKPKMDSDWHSSKGEHWTVLEHNLFLEGLEKFGKGSWKSISRLLKTRTSNQVASHAQKYFARVKKAEEKKKMLDEKVYDLSIGDKDVKGDNGGGSDEGVAGTQMGRETETVQCALREPVSNMGDKEGSRYYHPVFGDLRPFYPRRSNNEVTRIMDDYAQRKMGIGKKMRKEQKMIADTRVGSSVGNKEGSRHYCSVLGDYQPFYPRRLSNIDNMMIMGDNGLAQMEMGAEMRQEQRSIVDTGVGNSVGYNEGSQYYPRWSSNNDNMRIIGDNDRAQMKTGTKIRKEHKTIANTGVGSSVGNNEGSRYYPRWRSNSDNMRIMGDNARAQMGMRVEMRKEQKAIADIRLGSNVANNEGSCYYCPVLGNYRPFYPRRWSNNDNMRIMSDNGRAQMGMRTEMRKEHKSIADTRAGSNMANNKGSRYYRPALGDYRPFYPKRWKNNDNMRIIGDNARTQMGMEKKMRKEQKTIKATGESSNAENNERSQFYHPTLANLPPFNPGWLINNENMRIMSDTARTQTGTGMRTETKKKQKINVDIGESVNVANNQGSQYRHSVLTNFPPFYPGWRINNENMRTLDDTAGTQTGMITETRKEHKMIADRGTGSDVANNEGSQYQLPIVDQIEIGAATEPIINVANNEGSQYQCPILDGSQAVSPTENWWISDEDMKIMDELLSEFLPQ